MIDRLASQVFWGISLFSGLKFALLPDNHWESRRYAGPGMSIALRSSETR